jgi:hypothetical protein
VTLPAKNNSSESSPIPTKEMPTDQTPTSKRRKIRKGTTSCWECKRRKVRCSLVDEAGPACAACRRRGKKCLTQDHPEEGGDGAENGSEYFSPVIDQNVQGTPTPSATQTQTQTVTPVTAPNTYTRTDTPQTPTQAHMPSTASERSAASHWDLAPQLVTGNL